MRVISGMARGMRLFAPAGAQTRPTSDFVKESLFNILAGDCGGAAVLDLFAGSGAIGIEALSRNAASCTFVDESANCAAAIRRNLEKTRLGSNAKIICNDYKKALAAQSDQYDIIYIDPPYGQGLDISALRIIIENDILAKNGIIVLERLKNSSIETDFITSLSLEIYRQRQYSSTELIFLQHNGGNTHVHDSSVSRQL